MRSSIETTVQKANTQAFINVDPVALVLSRTPRVPNGAGGYRLGAPAAVASQVFRLVQQSNKGETGERVLLDGTVLQITHHLIAMPEADVIVGDHFSYGGRNYEVVSVHDVGGYELKAEVTTRA